MPKPSKKQIKPVKYRWRCHWNNGKSSYNADYENCSACSRGSTNLAAQQKAAEKHALSHRWGGWGYPTNNWRDHLVTIESIPFKKTSESCYVTIR